MSCSPWPGFSPHPPPSGVEGVRGRGEAAGRQGLKSLGRSRSAACGGLCRTVGFIPWVTLMSCAQQECLAEVSVDLWQPRGLLPYLELLTRDSFSLASGQKKKGGGVLTLAVQCGQSMGESRAGWSEVPALSATWHLNCYLISHRGRRVSSWLTSSTVLGWLKPPAGLGTWWVPSAV